MLLPRPARPWRGGSGGVIAHCDRGRRAPAADRIGGYTEVGASAARRALLSYGAVLCGVGRVAIEWRAAKSSLARSLTFLPMRSVSDCFAASVHAAPVCWSMVFAALRSNTWRVLIGVRQPPDLDPTFASGIHCRSGSRMALPS